jgi:hypothetical protein
MPFKKTTADIPPVIAKDFAKIPRPSAIAEAEGAGYVKNTPMKKAQQKNKGQFGLPKSNKPMAKG